ncbi:hypothetical protein [Aegicerativicinus sediminis]|uniref:hypothetical protein n=1 Tax=Aegicerativicinus sediminis TaxID=2893202 RepID=UPI001E47C481|nr:hypothetical protein [Aegicerativicinus sediminis]
MSRDNFTKSTISNLARRVGFLCSNPKCKRHTVGPNVEEEKSTLIGIAAHITAASPGGPRYDNNLNEEQRKHISNGIWLCSNCATLIDKDENSFSSETLKLWKEQAEMEMRKAILGSLAHEKPKNQIPFIEADLIYSNGMRLNRGYSAKNKEKFGGNIIPVGGKPIIFWEVVWNFSFVLHNNSSFPAYNIQIEEVSDVKFNDLTKLPKINNLPPFENIDLRANYEEFIEGEHTEADKLMNQKIPESIDGLVLRISYKDENRNEHQTIVKIEKQELINLK